MALLFLYFVVGCYVRLVARYVVLILTFIKDSMLSLMYPQIWNLETRSSKLKRLPKHVLLTGALQPQRRGRAFTTLDKLALFIAGSINLNVQQITIFLDSEYWTVQYVNELNKYLEERFAALGESVSIGLVLNDPADSYFKMLDRCHGLCEEIDIYVRKILIICPGCRKGPFDEADNIIYLQDRRNGLESFCSVLQEMHDRGKPPLTRDTLLAAWPGIAPSRPRVDKHYTDNVDLVISFLPPDCPNADGDRGIVSGIPPVALLSAEIMFAPPLQFTTINLFYRLLKRYSRSEQRRGL